MEKLNIENHDLSFSFSISSETLRVALWLMTTINYTLCINVFYIGLPDAMSLHCILLTTSLKAYLSF